MRKRERARRRKRKRERESVCWSVRKGGGERGEYGKMPFTKIISSLNIHTIVLSSSSQNYTLLVEPFKEVRRKLP